jgi:multidrug resistance protein
VLFVTVFIDLMGFGIVIPLLPLYADRLHATPFANGSLIAVFSLMQLLFAPVWGRISDGVGRRPVLLVSLFGSAVSYLLLAGAWSVEMLFAARILAGIAGANIPVAQAYMADVTGPDERAGAMGMIGAAFGLGMVIGPALGGGLSLVGPRVPELTAAALCLVNVVLAWWRLPESVPPTRRSARGFRHPLSLPALREAVAPPGAAVLLAVFFLVTVGFAVLEGTFSLAAKERFGYTPSQVDLLWLYMGVVAVVVQGGLVGRLAKRFPERMLVLAGAACLTAGFLWIPMAGGRGALLAALGLVIAGQGLASPSLSSLISKTGGGRGHGQVLGVSQSLSAGGRVLGPAGGGFVFGRYGAGAPYLVAAACAAGALGLVVPGARAGRPDEQETLALRRSG